MLQDFHAVLPLETATSTDAKSDMVNSTTEELIEIEIKSPVFDILNLVREGNYEAKKKQYLRSVAVTLSLVV